MGEFNNTTGTKRVTLCIHNFMWSKMTFECEILINKWPFFFCPEMYFSLFPLFYYHFQSLKKLKIVSLFCPLNRTVCYRRFSVIYITVLFTVNSYSLYCFKFTLLDNDIGWCRKVEISCLCLALLVILSITFSILTYHCPTPLSLLARIHSLINPQFSQHFISFRCSDKVLMFKTSALYFPYDSDQTYQPTVD